MTQQPVSTERTSFRVDRNVGSSIPHQNVEADEIFVVLWQELLVAAVYSSRQIHLHKSTQIIVMGNRNLGIGIL